MLPAMQSILTEPAASTLLVLDAMDGATLTEIARTTGRPLSTIQRAVNGLVDANVVVRETPRGRLRFTPEAPRHALRELAEWRLGKKDADRIARAARVALPASSWPSAPPTIRDELIRAAWPTAIQSIVSMYHPARVILFGSQARGDAGPGSDVDLLVVFAGEVNRRERRPYTVAEGRSGYDPRYRHGGTLHRRGRPHARDGHRTSVLFLGSANSTSADRTKPVI